ncbi:hypothetical protein ACFX16_030418 [Malus domestica]
MATVPGQLIWEIVKKNNSFLVKEFGRGNAGVRFSKEPKKQNKPASLLHKSVIRKEFTCVAKAVTNQVADNFYRPDLKKAALARLSAVHRGLRVAKSGAKKRNRQAVKTPGRK